VDFSDDSVFITGYFLGDGDYDPSGSVATLSHIASADIFVVKLDSDGLYVWAKRCGGSGGDQARDIAVDSSSNVYITGHFQAGCNFDPAGTFTLSNTDLDRNDAFVMKLDSIGNFQWAIKMGSTANEEGSGIV
jgi:hypothetical protein